MADEQTPVVDTPVDNTPAVESQPQERQFSETEQRALSQGWVPEELFEGNGKWRSAEEFLDRGELFEKIEGEKRRARALESEVQVLKKHYRQVRETEYRRALATLKAQKREALDTGDSERVIEIDDQIEATKRQAAQQINELNQSPQVAPEANPVFQVWVNRNPWYSSDRAMKIYADTVGEELAQRGMTDPVAVLHEVERRVRSEFSHKFKNPNREKAAAVESGGTSKSTKNDGFQLSAEETQVMNKLVKHGHLTKEEYIRDIKAMRGV